MKLSFLRDEPLKQKLLVAAGLLGILLLGVSEWFGSDKTEKPVEAPAASASLTAYQDALETRLEELIGQIRGVGTVRVMITFESGEETVYAVDSKTDAQGGSEQQHILLDTQQGESALAETVWLPQIQGAAVVCQGAADVSVNAQITELLTVLLGVSSNRISIAQMN